MTGGEIAAIGKAASVVGKKTLGEDEKTNDVLVRVAEQTPEMRAAARSKAARIAVKERVKLKLYQPFARMLGVSKEYFNDTFAQDIGTKIADIPDENLVTPPANIAVPALQGLSCTFGEPELKEMYLNLLATASDGRRTGQAHPAFVEIIKQLSPEEAGLLNWIFERQGLKIARVEDFVSVRRLLLSSIIPIDLKTNANPAERFPLSVWIDNWKRLGLATATFANRANRETEDWILEHPAYIQFVVETGNRHPSSYKGKVQITDFGRQFFRTVSCVEPVDAPRHGGVVVGNKEEHHRSGNLGRMPPSA